MVWCSSACLFTMYDLSVLTDLQPTTKDCKSLIPALVSFLQNFQQKFESSFSEMKSELLSGISQRDRKISELESDVDLLKKKVTWLEESLEEGQAYERRDVLIFSGKTLPPGSKDENCLQTVRNLTRQHLNYSLPENEISITHRLGANNSENKRSIIVKFCRRSTKTDILAAARKKKAPNFFANECLNPTQRTIGYVLRKAKCKFPDIISGSTTFDGIHNVWIRPPNPDAAGAQNGKQTITSLDRFETFCMRVLNKPVSHFIENRSQQNLSCKFEHF